MNLNKVFIIGRMTRDPEVKALPNGTKVAKFSVATSEVYKDQGGQKQEKTEFHNCVAFGRSAEVIGQYMKKGSEIMIEGKIKTRSWEDNQGNKKYATEIFADSFQFGQKPANQTVEDEPKVEDEQDEEMPL